MSEQAETPREEPKTSQEYKPGTVGANIEAWKKEYLEGDEGTQKVLKTLLVCDFFTADKLIEWLKETGEWCKDKSDDEPPSDAPGYIGTDDGLEE